MSAEEIVEKAELFRGVVKMKYYGKYRGKVTDNCDPDGLGRIRAKVPDVPGANEMDWATPCVPYAGNSTGVWFIPPIGANVWIEFERGETDFPIWSGGFWVEDDNLFRRLRTQWKMIKTGSATITFNDEKGAENITISPGPGDAETSLLKFVMNGNSIELVNGITGIKMNGNSIELYHAGGGNIKVDHTGIILDTGGSSIKMNPDYIELWTSGLNIKVGHGNVFVNDKAMFAY
jgi:uncharacterized protein involved in type VI secretion and phage assembly